MLEAHLKSFSVCLISHNLTLDKLSSNCFCSSSRLPNPSTYVIFTVRLFCRACWWICAKVFWSFRPLTTSGNSNSAKNPFVPSSRVPSPCIQVIYFLPPDFLEPVGGSSPKFSGSSILSSFLVMEFQPQTLSCPAQGSPIPAFRCHSNYI